MDWAEELKMSIRKTARKGRSKSRDLLKEKSLELSSSTASPTTANKELSIDITLDMQQSTSTTATPPTSSGNAFDSSDFKPPRRVSGGWADTSVLKLSKSKKSSFDDDRFQLPTPKSIPNSPQEDDIPIIPDLDDIKDEILLNEIAEPPSVTINRVVALKELNSDLLSQNAFSAIENVDLSILTRSLQSQETLDESDEVWEWDKLFTEVMAEIMTEKPTGPSEIATGPEEAATVLPRELLNAPRNEIAAENSGVYRREFVDLQKKSKN